MKKHEKKTEFNVAFLFEYFSNCTKYSCMFRNIDVHEIFQPLFWNAFVVGMLKDNPSEWEKNLRWAVKICERHEINLDCIADFGFMNLMFSDSLKLILTYKELRRMLTDHNIIQDKIFKIKNEDKEIIQKIIFHIKGDKQIQIDSKNEISHILQLMRKGYEQETKKIIDECKQFNDKSKKEIDTIIKFYDDQIQLYELRKEDEQEKKYLIDERKRLVEKKNKFNDLNKNKNKALLFLPSIKNPFTHDLRVFSWALLNYLNQFTQYKKTEKAKLATNEQCRIIFDILLDVGYLRDDRDPNFVRTYLQQAAVKFS